MFIRKNTFEKEKNAALLIGLAKGLAIGSAVGATVGVLTAPKAGWRTRRDIKRISEDTKEKIENKIK